MISSSLAKVVLISALVFSQTLYAGHTMLHNDSSQMDCQICLHATPGGAVLPAGELDAIINLPYQPHRCSRVAPAISSTFHNPHPSRAPPFPGL